MSYSPSQDFGLQAARGLVPNIATVNKFGRAPLGVQTTSTDIWSRADAAATQQIWLCPTAARVHAIVSTSASDAAAGVGARTIRITGLRTWDLAESSEDITLNGVTPVNTVNSYVIIHRMKVLTSGATNINVGTINATAATDGTITAQIAPSQGQTQMAIYGVPSTQDFYLKRFFCYMNDTNAARAVDLQIRVNENPNVQTTNFINKTDIQLSNAATSSLDSTLEIPAKFAGPCIIKVQGVASNPDLDVSSGFDGYLVTK